MSANMMCNNLLIGISGSIHALQIYTYLRLFRESLAQHIKVIMTQNATYMIDPKTLEMFVDENVFIDPWDQQVSSENKVPHIQLTRWADMFVIVPATANILGKAAHGIADDLLSTAILSYTKSIVFVPAMNIAMFQNKVLQRNIKALENDGHYIIPPEKSLAFATGEPEGVASTPEMVLLHLKHRRMKELRDGYWEEAIHEKPLTPREKKLRDIEQRQAEKIRENI